MASIEETLKVALQLSEMLPPWFVKLTRSVATAGTRPAHCTVTAEGQFTTGGVTSLTMKATTQALELFEASFTVTVTGCAPRPETVLPWAGLCVTVSETWAVQLSEDWLRTSVRRSGTVALHEASASALWSGTFPQLIGGGVLSV